MNENTTKKLTRRDALKALGAALGGTALAALPPVWSKPALAAGQLPEHARQSYICHGHPMTPDDINNNGVPLVGVPDFQPGDVFTYSATITGAGTLGGSHGPFYGTSTVDQNGVAWLGSGQLGAPAGFVAGDSLEYLIWDSTGLLSFCGLWEII